MLCEHLFRSLEDGRWLRDTIRVYPRGSAAHSLRLSENQPRIDTDLRGSGNAVAIEPGLIQQEAAKDAKTKQRIFAPVAAFCSKTWL